MPSGAHIAKKISDAASRTTPVIRLSSDVRTADAFITLPSGKDGSGKFLEEFYVIMWI